ncbi:MAG: phenazine biosynthesis protein PhzF [Methylocystis sp.]|nr:MAG: phenazine biosynthesis protein PhzF [Methylocystis sp.]
MTRGFTYHLLDVFTDKRFCGNPLAVVEGADALDDTQMQAIAREFNLSETVFLLEPHDPVHSARMRIFTPQRELPFAGHPVVGTAALLAETRAGDVIARSDVVVVLETQIGPLRCEALRARNGVTYAEAALPILPAAGAGEGPNAEVLAAALSVPPEEIGFRGHVPTVFAAGPAFVFAPMRSRRALESARRDAALFAAALGEAVGAFLYTHETIEPQSAIHARMLAHGLGFDEDPATGSAAAAFAAVACAFENPDDGEHQIFIEQGYAIGRPSRITLRMTVENGALARVAVGGQVVRVAEGKLRL